MLLSESPPGEKRISAVAASRGLAMLQNEGKRVLACSFCRHEWSAYRIFCPFCENTDSDTLQYFVVQDDDEHRVDVCENCKRFIKTVDLRKISRIIYPPLEQIATLHLDMKASEAGYVSGLGFLFEFFIQFLPSLIVPNRGTPYLFLSKKHGVPRFNLFWVLEFLFELAQYIKHPYLLQKHVLKYKISKSR